MSPVAAAVIGLLFGLLLGAGVVVALAKPPESDAARPVVHRDEVADIIGVVRAGVAIMGPHDEILASNPSADRLGLVRGSRIGFPEILEAVRAARREGVQGGVDVEERGRLGSGTQLAVRVVPLDDGRVFVVADDRTPALRAAESTRDFMTNATHELKTPIGAISLMAEALVDYPDDTEAVARFGGKIHDEATRLAALVGQILVLSKLQARGALSAAAPVEVDELVAQALDRCGDLASGRDVSLTTSGASGLWVFGDADQLATALVNLVTNAVNYSDRRARVVVTTRRGASDVAEGATDAGASDWVEIAVSDNGIGMSTDDAKRVFERFYRVDPARSRETGGTGLGLSIVNEIVEGHGGTVTVWSQLGQGSTFTLRLPASAPAKEDQ